MYRLGRAILGLRFGTSIISTAGFRARLQGRAARIFIMIRCSGSRRIMRLRMRLIGCLVLFVSIFGFIKDQKGRKKRSQVKEVENLFSS